MASIFGHAASAWGFMQVMPNYQKYAMVLGIGILCAIMPDMDVITHDYGLGRHHILAHRGLTHSIPFACIWSSVIVFLFHLRDASVWKYFTFYFLATASHGILDAMTTGGAGIAFFAPFSGERYFLPWRPILVSPLGAKHFFSEWGINVLKTEFVYIGIPCIALFLVRKLISKK